MSEAGMHLFIGFKGLDLDQELRFLIKEYHPAGVVLFKRNIEGREQLKALVAGARALAMEHYGHPLLFAVDQEGGSVQRLASCYNSLPSAHSLARQGRESVARWAAICAADLRDIGVQINFAPVLDIVVDPQTHFMTSRSFGPTPEQVAALATLWIETLQAGGVSATAKHFPGLGRASLDPHHFAPTIAGQSREDFKSDLIPFEAAIRSKVNCMMTSHAVYPSVDPAFPATFSHEICRTWLRKRLGFQGVLFADDLDMAAIARNYSPQDSSRLGLNCSIDFFLLCQRSESIEPMHRALCDLLESDSSLQSLHRESVARIEKLLSFHQVSII